MSSCQKYVKCQKVKCLDHGGGSQKYIEIIWFTDIDVNFDIPRWSPIQVLTELMVV